MSARPLPYQLLVTGLAGAATRRFSIEFDHTGAAGASLLVNAGTNAGLFAKDGKTAKGTYPPNAVSRLRAA